MLCRFGKCDVITVGNAAVSNKPFEVAINTGCAKCGPVAAEAAKLCASC